MVFLALPANKDAFRIKSAQREIELIVSGETFLGKVLLRLKIRVIISQ